MNKFVALSIGILLSTAAHSAHAKAAYQTPQIMIANSQAIALVQIERIEATQTKGENWTYGQKATAHVERTLKGGLPATLTLLGDENFICARCHFETGRFLVFLKREGAGWVGTNYQPSARKIEDERVNWDAAAPFAQKPIALDVALQSVISIIAAQKQTPRYSLSTGTQDKVRVWQIIDEGNPKNERTLKQKELEEWLVTLILGTKLSLCNSCLGNNATSAEVETLRNFAYAFGLEFVVIPAG